MANDSHIKGTTTKGSDATSGPVPMSHRNKLGIKDLQSNPQGAGKPSVTPKISNGGKKCY